MELRARPSVQRWLVNAIFVPSGDQYASSSTSYGAFGSHGALVVLVLVRFRLIDPYGSWQACTSSRQSSTLMTKMSLSVVAEPGSSLNGRPSPDAEAWNAMCLLSDDQLALLPRVRYCSSVPSV